MSAPGSMAAHDDLRTAMTLWRLAEAAFDARPDPAHAAAADVTWLAVVKTALNCGMPASEPSIQRWVMRRLNTYHASLGVGEI